jgi:excisionase family DNA binding protein
MLSTTRREYRSPAPCLVDTIHGRARRLGVSELTVRRRIKRGTVPAVRIGGTWRVLAPERGSPYQLPETCSVGQVANSLDISQLTVRRLIKAGELQAHKDGRRWSIPREVLVCLLVEPTSLTAGAHADHH